MRLRIALTFLWSTLGLFQLFAQEPLELYVQAKEFITKGQLNEALKKFDDAIRLDASNYKFYHDKARLQFKMKQSEQAVETMKKAIEHRADHLESHEVLARYYNFTKQYDEAIIYFDNAFKYAESKEDKFKFKLEIIRLLDEQLHQLEKGGNHINDLKQIAPNDPTALYYEAKYYNVIGDYGKARDAAIKSTGLVGSKSPDEQAAHYFELGKAYYMLEDYQKMDEAFAKARNKDFMRDIQMMSPQYFFMLAMSYHKVYEVEESERLVSKTLKMRPDYSRAHELQVKIADSKIEKSLVIQHQKNAIEAETNLVKRAEKYADLSEIELQGGRYEDAIKSADACLQVEPKNYAVTFFKAVAQSKLGKHTEAITTLTELIAYKGIDAETKAQYNFALGLFHEKKAAAAKDAATKKQILAQAVERYKAADYGTFRYVAQERIRAIMQAD